MKEFIEFIIKHLVDKPDEVQVNEIVGKRTVVFELRVGKGDMGKVIGRRGQTAISLRTLIAAAAAKQGKRAVLEILEDETEKAIFQNKKKIRMNIYVGNLSRDVTEDDLKEAFEAFGEIASVNVIKDKFSGEPRGFGFVEMPSKDEAQSAIDGLNGTDLKGQSLNVKEAHPRTESRGGNR
jgi:predicted RNA-binding protein YlqC (UPF0109 family)